MLKLLRYILFPFSLIYAVAVYVRNFLFDIGIFRSQTFSTPTITIGNLSVGGTGKTPMTAYIIELLGSEYKIAVLSRGYKRKSKGFFLADDNSKVSDLGDEPFQIANKYPNIVVAVDTNRRNGIHQLEKRVAPELILLDDAYQHRWVKPSASLLLTSYDKLYSTDWYLPTGNLRDSKNQSKRADLIVVTKCPELPSSAKRTKILSKLRPMINQKVVFGTLKYEDHFIGINSKLGYDDLRRKKIALVTGIANPKPLVKFLKGKGVNFEYLKFSDHHNFTNNEINSFRAYDVVLTTEKDFVRFENRLNNAYFLGVKHSFSVQDKEVILNMVRQVLKPVLQSSS